MENLVNAKVVYKDVDNHNKIVQMKNISGQENIPISLNFYRQHVPMNYRFKGFGHFDHYLKNGAVNVIYIQPRHPTSQQNAPQGTIVIDYISANSQLVGHKSVTDNVGRTFNVNRCKAMVPSDYQFDRILTGANVNQFKSSSQIMMVQVKKIQHAKIDVRFLYNTKFIGDLKTKVVAGKHVDMDRYIRMVPARYKFVKVNGPIPNVIHHDTVINVQVAPKQPKPQANPNRQANNDRVSAQKVAKQSQKATSKLSHSEDPKKIGAILMKLAASLHDLGMSISKSNRL